MYHKPIWWQTVTNGSDGSAPCFLDELYHGHHLPFLKVYTEFCCHFAKLISRELTKRIDQRSTGGWHIRKKKFFRNYSFKQNLSKRI